MGQIGKAVLNRFTQAMSNPEIGGAASALGGGLLGTGAMTLIDNMTGLDPEGDGSVQQYLAGLAGAGLGAAYGPQLIKKAIARRGRNMYGHQMEIPFE